MVWRVRALVPTDGSAVPSLQNVNNVTPKMLLMLFCSQTIPFVSALFQIEIQSIPDYGRLLLRFGM